MSRFKMNKKFGSYFVIFNAILLILFGSIQFSLGLIGEKDTAIITNIRRQGGERNESVPNRYTYSISYSFTLPDGRKIDGFTYKIGDSVYIKVSHSNLSMLSVRYLKALPQINAPESDTGFKPGNFILIGTGILIIKLIKPKKKGRPMVAPTKLYQLLR